METTILVVCYKKSVLESTTLETLRANDLSVETKLVVWENSPIQKIRLEDLEPFRAKGTEVLYEFHPENTPLSKVYNIQKRGLLSGGQLVLFDDDTCVTQAYLDEIQVYD